MNELSISGRVASMNHLIDQQIHLPRLQNALESVHHLLLCTCRENRRVTGGMSGQVALESRSGELAADIRVDDERRCWIEEVLRRQVWRIEQ